MAPSDFGSEVGSSRSLDQPPWLSRENLENYSTSWKSSSADFAGDLNGNDNDSTKEEAFGRVLPTVTLDDSYHTHLSMDYTPSSEGGATNKGFSMNYVTSESSDTRKSQQRLFDSAIFTDFASSDSNSDSGYLPKSSKNFESSLGITPEEPILDLEVDNSRAASLEWDEMRLRSATGTGSAMGSIPDVAEIDQLTHGALAAPKSNRNFCGNSLKHLPSGQRDLMVFAREKYFTNLEVIKVLHQLYKRRRLRRVLELCPSLYGPVQACLLSLLHQGFSIFKCNSFDVVAEAVEVSLKRCSFLSKWILPSHVREMMGLRKTWDMDSVKSAMTSCLKHLWDLDCTSTNQISDVTKGPILLEAVKLLMVLKSLEVYDHTLSLRHPLRPFYAELFLRKSPRNIMEDLHSAGWSRAFTELEIALMAESLGIRLEIFKLTTSRPHVAAVYPDKMVAPPGVTILQLDTESSHFMPLFVCEE